MIRALYIATLLLASTTAYAQEDDPEQGLVEGHLIGGEATQAAPVIRPQLVTHDRTTPAIIGGISAAVGGMGLIASFVVYAARQNYRLRPWRSISDSTISSWETQGAVSLWMGVGASGLLITSEYLLLPESLDTPTLAWFAGAAGVGVAAVGLGFWVGGTHCGPQASSPGADLILACSAGTADAEFGPLLIASAMPLINIPLVYLLRKAFAGAPESLSIGPGGVNFSGRF